MPDSPNLSTSASSLGTNGNGNWEVRPTLMSAMMTSGRAKPTYRNKSYLRLAMRKYINDNNNNNANGGGRNRNRNNKNNNDRNESMNKNNNIDISNNNDDRRPINSNNYNLNSPSGHTQTSSSSSSLTFAQSKLNRNRNRGRNRNINRIRPHYSSGFFDQATIPSVAYSNGRSHNVNRMPSSKSSSGGAYSPSSNDYFDSLAGNILQS